MSCCTVMTTESDRPSVLNNTFQFEGWVEKKRQDQTFIFNEDYQKRYLAITTTTLIYFHSKSNESRDMDSYDGCIPLSVICEVKLSTNDVGLFFIDIGSRIFAFKADTVEVAGLWVENIIYARHFLLNKIFNRSNPFVISQQLAHLKFWKNKRNANNMKDLLLVDPFTTNEVDAILRIEEILLNNKAIHKNLSHAFFQAIQSFPKKFQIDQSKELGISFILWLASKGDAQEIVVTWNESYLNGSNNSRNTSTTTSANIVKDIIQYWFESALSSELTKSCDIHRGSSNIPNNEEDNQQDMPFRADQSEVLFLTSSIRTSIQASSILSQWLSTVILTTTECPDNYIFTSNNKQITTSDIQSSTFIKRQSNSTKNNNSFLKLQLSSKVFNHPDDTVYFQIIRLCSLIIQKIHAFKLHLPETAIIFINVLKNLTLNNNYDWNNKDTNSNQLTRIFDIPNEKVFFMSFNAVLFLRLLCPALISPLEWGSLRNIHSLLHKIPSQNNLDISNNNEKSNTGSKIATARKSINKKVEKALNYSRRISLTPNMASNNHINSDKFGCPTPFIVILCYVLNHLNENELMVYLADQTIEISQELIKLIKYVGNKVEIDKVTSIINEYQTKITELTELDKNEINNLSCQLDSTESRRALIEVARVLQKIANMSCMSESDMDGFLITDMILHKKRTNNENLLIEEENIFIQELKSAALMLKKFYIDLTINKSERKSIFI